MANYYSVGVCHASFDDAVNAWQYQFPVRDSHNTKLNFYDVVSIVKTEPSLTYQARHSEAGTVNSSLLVFRTCDRPELLSDFSITDITFLGFAVLILAIGFLSGQQR